MVNFLIYHHYGMIAVEHAEAERLTRKVRPTRENNIIVQS